MGKERKAALVITVTNELNKFINVAREKYTASRPGTDQRNIRYQWKFKEFYPRFATGYDSCQPLPRDISSWTEWDLDLCITAMIRKYFHCEATVVESPQIPESPLADMRARVDSSSETASEDPDDRRRSNTPDLSNTRERAEAGPSKRESPTRPTPKARKPAAKVSPYSALREIMEFHETSLQSLLDTEHQKGREAQQRESDESGLGDLLRADERARRAEKERDVARVELKSLQQTVEQLLDDARKEGEAAGAARAMQQLEGLFAAAKQNYPKHDVGGRSNEPLPSPKMSMPPRNESLTIVAVEPQQRVERPPTRPAVKGLLSDILASLPPPMRIKSRKQILPVSFVETVMCKNDNTITTKSTDNKRLDIVDWRTIIRVDPELHESAPDFHKHGALTFVHGEPSSGREEKARADRVGNEKAESYPVFRRWQDPRTKAEGYYYIGHYKVSSIEIVPRVTWDSWPLTRKRLLARNLLQSPRATEVLRQKNIAITLNRALSDAETEEMIDELLFLFYREEEPRLLMQHTVLKQTQFCFRQCEKVAFEFDFDENGRDVSALKRTAAEASETTGFAEEWTDGGGGKRMKIWGDEDDSDDLYEASQSQ